MAAFLRRGKREGQALDEGADTAQMASERIQIS